MIRAIALEIHIRSWDSNQERIWMK